MGFSITSKNQMLNGVTIDTIKLHSADPGAAGTTAAIAGATSACTYASATDGATRSLSAAVTGIAVPAATTVSHFSLWMGATFKAGKAFNTSETYTSAGTASVTSATITIADI